MLAAAAAAAEVAGKNLAVLTTFHRGESEKIFWNNFFSESKNKEQVPYKLILIWLKSLDSGSKSA